MKDHISDVEKKNAEARAIFDKQEVIENAAAEIIKVNMRCELGTNESPRRGIVLHVGTVNYSEGIWVGVKLDEPTGKHDGTVQV